MPFIITTTTSYPRVGAATADHNGVYELSRVAVATPDEARQAIIDIGAAHDTWIGGDALHGPIDRNGGTVGPLPDGIVIEVRPVSYDYLAGQVFDRDDYAPVFEVDILAAFNARVSA